MKILGQANLLGLLNTLVKQSIVRLILGLCLGLTVPISQSMAGASDSMVNQVKTAFIYNFIAFAQWPDRTEEYLDLCIYGEDYFHREIDKLKDKPVNNRYIRVNHIDNLEELKECQVIFFSESVNDNLSSILKDLQNEPILTLADSSNAVSQGIMINMDLVNEKIVFEVNLSVARRSGINFSSKLLQLAVEVHE